MAGGAKLLGEGVAEKGKGVGARRVGVGGWRKGWGKGGQGGGIYIKMKFWTKQVSLNWVWLSECTLPDEIGWNLQFRGGFPNFGRESLIMTSYSRKNVTFSLQKREGERFQPWFDCAIPRGRRSGHLENLNMLAHFEFLNSNISLMNGP